MTITTSSFNLTVRDRKGMIAREPTQQHRGSPAMFKDNSTIQAPVPFLTVQQTEFTNLLVLDYCR